MAAALTLDQLGQLAWINGGLRDVDSITKAVAIAMRESRGIPDKVNVNTDAHKSHDVGLWQINTYWHRDKGFTEEELKKPAINATAMGLISNSGKDWGAWDGPSYQQWVPAAKKAAIKTVALGAAGTIKMEEGLLETFTTGLEVGGKAIADNPIAALAEAFSFLTDAVGTLFGAILDAGWWKRLALGAASVILIAVGASLVSRDALLPPQLQALMNLATKG